MTGMGRSVSHLALFVLFKSMPAVATAAKTSDMEQATWWAMPPPIEKHVAYTRFLSLEFAVSLELLDSVLELEISMELLDSFFSSVVEDSLEMLFSSLLELDDAVSFGSVEDESPQAHIPTTTATVDNRPMRLFCFIAFL